MFRQKIGSLVATKILQRANYYVVVYNEITKK